MMIALRLDSRLARRVLLHIAVTLTATSFALGVIAKASPIGRTLPLERLSLRLLRNFDARVERSVPTAWSIVLLLGTCAIAALIARLHQRRELPHGSSWCAISAMFLLFAVDDFLGIHEQVSSPLRQMLGSPAAGVVQFEWVLPALVVVALGAVIFRRLATLLSASMRRQFLLAALLLVGSTLGLELILGLAASANSTGAGAGAGNQSLTFLFLANIREGGKLVGESLFVVVTLDYLFTLADVVTVSVQRGPRSQDSHTSGQGAGPCSEASSGGGPSPAGSERP